jgi:hypothetical protein
MGMCRGAAVLHLNPWPIDEFLKLAHCMGVPADVALDRYRIFGGVPRPALTDLTRTVSDLEMEVSAMQADQLVMPSLLGVRSEFSHTLVHVRVGSWREACTIADSTVGFLQFKVQGHPAELLPLVPADNRSL